MRDMLPDEYEFVFFDGGHECEPAPEVADAYAPPFKTWYNTPTTTKVTDAHRQVRSIISEHGPFDAVLGFSQVIMNLAVSPGQTHLTPTNHRAQQ